MFTSIVLAFYALFFLSLSFTIYLYIRLLVAVRQGKDVPKWIYKLGHAIQGRIHVDYEEITDANALKEIHWFFLIYLIINLLLLAGFYYHSHSFPQAIYECLKKQFFIVLVSMVLKSIGKFIVLTIRKNFQNSHAYASTNAFIGTAFLTSYVFMFCMMMSGLPAQPVPVSIQDTTVIIGETKASELLDQGFSFDDKSPESPITNPKNDHFYYGQLLEVKRDNQSYGFMSLTPTGRDTDQLKNCIITYYRTPKDDHQLQEISINHVNLANLKFQDFQTRKLIDIFQLNPADYEESKNPNNFTLTIQTADYDLWKRYRIEVKFNTDGSLDSYGVRAQHSMWE
ncbi:hypothetical protein SPD57_03135 [Streptococcus sp. BJSWXB6CM1]|uniref:Uncharacterized protein n=1 Tax=Streptococcus fermentans TaxID=3095082 RepID=A0ABU5G0I8_9STRE|nr:MULTISPECIES: hypothetical protein [unclassified Streptococcus]MDY4345688.1 hypothetical protein [Streptococcus sp. BJSWXB5TM5]MDY4360780.1 hypothetical protein [Streptococcus sp. BJSWXB3CM3]MDY4370913.1 hypothetical protein [Streptococcus sp. BJSWXB6CM1]